MLNFSPSCERNQAVIAETLAPYFSQKADVLEIGSLSGQHAIHFCQQFSQLLWRPSDLVTNVAALQNNIVQAALSNCLPAIALDVANKATWPNKIHDIIYSANTLHIMSWQDVQALFSSLHQVSSSGTLLAIYGPFNYNNAFSSPSNEQFELWLKDRDEKSGIRDFEQVNNLAIAAGFTLQKDIAMPANNQLLIWKMN